MPDDINTDEIWALLTEADESRRLARTLPDLQAGLDLEAYASALEAEATELENAYSRQTESPSPYALGKRLSKTSYFGRA